MKTVYRGAAYIITCGGGLHRWVRLLTPGRGRIFGVKYCDCKELDRLGVKLPMRSAMKVALGYQAPGNQVVLARVVMDGKELNPMGRVHGDLRDSNRRDR